MFLGFAVHNISRLSSDRLEKRRNKGRGILLKKSREK